MDSASCVLLPCYCAPDITHDESPQKRMCPACHNPTVGGATIKDWVEVFWIPIFPLTTKHVWICSHCQWTNPQGEGADPPLAPPYFGPYGSPWPPPGPMMQYPSPYVTYPPAGCK
ncbi:hypothetical protein AX16_002319 [Volvariella volvacea WC 439]|nr:hypothetical protein AX16_002309 [Volvariella volvacea WC 439]KAF8656964.1 hypothetical protein AX16_002319 [Volvariella volvacea WC 439]